MLQNDLDAVFAVIAGAIVAGLSVALIGGIMFVVASVSVTFMNVILTLSAGLLAGLTSAIALYIDARRYWRSTESRD